MLRNSEGELNLTGLIYEVDADSIPESCRAFQSIYEKTNSIAPAVGILTGVNRDLWADVSFHCYV